MRTIFVIFMLLHFFKCTNQNKKENQTHINPNQTMEKNLSATDIVNQEGIIGYWESLNKYTINFSKAGTYDGQVTGIIQTDLSDIYKKQGMAVVFNGKIYQNSETPKPMMGGQQVFWLKLDSIKAK